MIIIINRGHLVNEIIINRSKFIMREMRKTNKKKNDVPKDQEISNWVLAGWFNSFLVNWLSWTCFNCKNS